MLNILGLRKSVLVVGFSHTAPVRCPVHVTSPALCIYRSVYLVIFFFPLVPYFYVSALSLILHCAVAVLHPDPGETTLFYSLQAILMNDNKIPLVFQESRQSPPLLQTRWITTPLMEKSIKSQVSDSHQYTRRRENPIANSRSLLRQSVTAFRDSCQ